LVSRHPTSEQALDRIEGKLGAGGGSTGAGAGVGDASPSVAAFDQLVADHLGTFADLSKKIAPEVDAQAQAFLAAIAELKKARKTNCKKQTKQTRTT